MRPSHNSGKTSHLLPAAWRNEPDVPGADRTGDQGGTGATLSAELNVIQRAEARRILSPTSGFIAEAGFTHSLTPARNCTFGCTYCYVPTLGVYGGLKPEDWQRWGQFTTFKTNAAELLECELRARQTI